MSNIKKRSAKKILDEFGKRLINKSKSIFEKLLEENKISRGINLKTIIGKKTTEILEDAKRWRLKDSEKANYQKLYKRLKNNLKN